MASLNDRSEFHTELSRRIVGWMKLRNLKMGEHVTEHALANELNVSRSPIRGALSILSDMGILERKAHRGCFVICDLRAIDLDEMTPKETKEERFYREIARDRFRGELPIDFTEVELRRRYNMGHATLKAVLRHLFNDSLILPNPGKGWRFHPTLNTEKSQDDSYRLRLTIEPAAVLEPTFDLDRDLARVVRAKHEELLETGVEDCSIVKVYNADADFHDLIGISSRNIYFESIIKMQNRLRRLLEYEFVDNYSRLGESCREHLYILEALETRQQFKAADLLRIHLTNSIGVKSRVG
ncbi:MAG TPA: GntR family transcriptional regulator [Nitrospira sp.]|nr:GntR family transcriptional regulator [Nitrospira sp.]